MPGTRCSVVVCTQDRPKELERCLQHLRRLTYPQVEIVVVDSAPREAPARELAQRCQAKYIHEPAPGLSRARNAGARSASSDAVAFLDDDAFPRADWLEKLLAPFDDPGVAVATGGIYAPEAQSEAEKRWEGMGGFRPAAGSPESMDRNTPGWFRAAHFGALGNGSNMAFRRELWSQWSGFNEDLGRGHRVPGGEEHYAFFELIERGYRVVYVPGAVVYHPAPDSAQALERHFVEVLEDGGMYLAYVYARLPRYRGELYRMGWGYLRNQLGARGKPAELSAIGISRTRQMAAVARGVLRYWRSA